jgi:hypothetical protein
MATPAKTATETAAEHDDNDRANHNHCSAGPDDRSHSYDGCLGNDRCPAQHHCTAHSDHDGADDNPASGSNNRASYNSGHYRACPTAANAARARIEAVAH